MLCVFLQYVVFFFTAPAPSEIYTLSLHDALPICCARGSRTQRARRRAAHRSAERSPRCSRFAGIVRSEEHTSELQSRPHLVCRLLLEKKKFRTELELGWPKA